jgi:predicted Zn-dependent protease
MRGNTRGHLIHEQREGLEQKRSAESRARKEKRREKGRAADIARAIKCSPAGKKAAGAVKEKRGIARKKEQANYQRTLARASTRMGGRRKQVLAEFQDQVEE